MAGRAIPREIRMDVRPARVKVGAQVRLAHLSRATHRPRLAERLQPLWSLGPYQLLERVHGRRERAAYDGLRSVYRRVYQPEGVSGRRAHVRDHQ